MKKWVSWLRGLVDAKLLKFVLVGLLNTFVGNGLMFLLYNLAGLGYWPSSAVGYIVASVVSFFLNRSFTFSSKGKMAGQVLRFAANIAACYLIAYGAARPLVFWLFASFSLAVRDNVAMLAGAGIFVCLNYLGQRLIVFAQKPEENTANNENG